MTKDVQYVDSTEVCLRLQKAHVEADETEYSFYTCVCNLALLLNDCADSHQLQHCIYICIDFWRFYWINILVQSQKCKPGLDQFSWQIVTWTWTYRRQIALQVFHVMDVNDLSHLQFTTSLIFMETTTYLTKAWSPLAQIIDFWLRLSNWEIWSIIESLKSLDCRAWLCIVCLDLF